MAVVSVWAGLVLFPDQPFSVFVIRFSGRWRLGLIPQAGARFTGPLRRRSESIVIDYPALCALFDAPSASSLAALNLDSMVEWDRLNSFAQNPKLRKWQSEALPAALCSIYAHRAGVVAATTGAGKSILQAEILRLYLLNSPYARVVVTTPSIRLVDQLAETFSAWLPPGMVGKWYTHHKQGGRQVIVCCNPSANSRRADQPVTAVIRVVSATTRGESLARAGMAPMRSKSERPAIWPSVSMIVRKVSARPEAML